MFQSQIAMVTQDTSLLHRSIRDNIRYGRPQASEWEVRRAAAQAHAIEFIEGLEDWYGRRGFDAHVGERGVKLSGGQRQRIALARVILKDAPILVLDEATSALDSEVEAAIQSNLRETTTLMLASLTPREERIVRMRFGLGMNSDHTLEEVGRQFSLTRERIRQIEARALRKLKHPSRSRELRSFLDS